MSSWGVGRARDGRPGSDATRDQLLRCRPSLGPGPSSRPNGPLRDRAAAGRRRSSWRAPVSPPRSSPRRRSRSSRRSVHKVAVVLCQVLHELQHAVAMTLAVADHQYLGRRPERLGELGVPGFLDPAVPARRVAGLVVRDSTSPPRSWGGQMTNKKDAESGHEGVAVNWAADVAEHDYAAAQA